MYNIIIELRSLVADIVTKHAPSLIYYLAERASRTNLSVRTTFDMIKILDEDGARQIRLSRNNAVYLLDILNAFDYYYNSAEPILIKSGNRQFGIVDFSTPRFHEISGFADFPIMCPSLTEPFVTIQQYLDFANLNEGGIAIDLGCYSALTSIAFSKKVGESGRVIALEPDPVNYFAAEKNIHYHLLHNKLSNITLMANAAGAASGPIRFSSEGSMGSAAISIVGDFRGESINVDCITLQDVVDLNRLDKVDFVKMDIEGSEEAVIASSDNFFRRYKPRIIIEPHVVNGILATGKVSSILEGFGYCCETIEQVGVALPLVIGIPRL